MLHKKSIEAKVPKITVVAGWRYYKNYGHVKQILDRYDIIEVLEGGQRLEDRRGKLIGGVDYHARVWAESENIPCRTFEANWGFFHKAAGPIRNRKMAEEAEKCKNGGRCIAIWNGKSKGTASMLGMAEAHKLQIVDIRI